jgi:hypothetical protein
MSRNGSGTYTLPAGNPVVTGTTISSTWANSTLTNIASALTDSLAADGQTTATGNLKMGNNRITGLADGIADTDGATVSQVNAAGFTVAPGTAGNVLTSNGTIWTSAAPAPASGPIPSGTVMLFYQAAAPTGWTQVTTQNDKALRVVSGTGGGTGGTTAFTTVFANQTVSTSISVSGTTGATTLSTAQIPSHSHSGGSGGSSTVDAGSTFSVANPPGNTGAEGGGGSHTHSFSGSGSGTSSAVTLNVQYIDIILCSKN